MSMAAWTTVDPFRHPWFTSASLKRKHSDSSSDDEAPASKFAQASEEYDSVPSIYPTPPQELIGGIVRGSSVDAEEHGGHGLRERKKRRYDLERKMARLRIEPSNLASGVQQTSSADLDMGLANVDLTLPPPAIPRLFPSAQPISQANSASSFTSNSSYATARSHTYSYGSLSPVLRNSILDEYAIEEPVSPEFDGNVSLAPNNADAMAPEVRMKGSDPAWYEREKDRIVITDLDEVIEEVEKEQRALEDEYKSEAEPHPDSSEYAESNADYSISSVLLDHIKRQSPSLHIPNLKKQNEPGALVLFRPPPVSFFLPPDTPSDRSTKDDVQVEEVDIDAENIVTPPGGFVVGNVSEIEGDAMDMDVDP